MAIPELMRLLVDEHGMSWPESWQITTAVFSYTNHTLLPEALETWPVAMFERLLPRHLQIIYLINRDFLQSVEARYPGDDGLRRRLSIIDDEGERRVRMAHWRSSAATGSTESLSCTRTSCASKCSADSPSCIRIDSST